MFDDFKETQFVSYSLLKNAIINNKLSHAYLIDGNNYEYGFDFVMAFVKAIICNNHYTNFEKCGDCNLCKRIDEGNYTEVKIIETNSLIIKKEQLLDLQNSFSRTGIESSKRVYVIRDCDKMNKQSSNSLLKFLEEPQNDIIAILSTIISRCQIIKLNNVTSYTDKAILNFAYSFCERKNEIEYFLNDDHNNKLLNDTIDFIKYFEDNRLDIFIYLKNMWYNNYSTKEDSLKIISLMVNFYFDVLKFKYDLNNYYFNDYIDFIRKVADNNNLSEIINKIEVCYSKFDDLKYNLNVNLLVDDMVIRLGECDECCRG